MQSRSVDLVVPALKTLEGAGFIVHRSFPTNTLSDVDPFLLLDEMGPMDVKPGEAKGAPDHPHRGFETVTYMISGAMEHEDSAGNAGSIGPGDVQWMTAGSGVIHSEMPGTVLREEGGRMHGFQLWVNLPRVDKMMAPRYQEIPAAKIPIATSPDGKARVRVIAGGSLGVAARIDTRTPIVYLHVTLQPGGRIAQAMPPELRAFAYVFGGSVKAAGSELVARHTMVAFQDDGDTVVLEAGDEGAEVLILGGKPLGEPIARYGPFVMNTQAEIMDTIRDYQAGRFAPIKR